MDISQYDCVYCGMDAIARDHLRPFSYDNIRTTRSESNYKDLTNIIPACTDCNNMLSNMMFKSIADKAEYIARRLSVRFKKVLASPDWTEEDLSELGHSLKSYVKKTQNKKKLVQARIAFAKERSKLTELTPTVFWQHLGKF